MSFIKDINLFIWDTRIYVFYSMTKAGLDMKHNITTREFFSL